jgi:DNA-binding MarR family transcriptional regulator
LPASKHLRPIPATTPPTTLELDTTVRLRAVIGRLSRRLRPTDAGTVAGLTPTRISILLTVVREGPVRISDLAEAEGINPTMLSRVISDLVEAGLLERVSDERDRRAARVETTRSGRGLAERMRRERTDALILALESLTAADRRQVELALPSLEALAEQLKRRRR